MGHPFLTLQDFDSYVCNLLHEIFDNYFGYGVPHDEMRWKLYPLEDWKHEILKVKDYAVGRSTRFKKINNTLESDTLNGNKSP